MLRSTLFNLSFYVVSVLFLTVGSPLLLGPRSWAMFGLRMHARACSLLFRWIVGVRVEVRGHEHLPKGACLVASKHQSAWDTFGLIPLFRDPALVMKNELMWVPFYGWFSYKFGMIPIKRERGPSALRSMLRTARARADAGREIVIFPEGTRRSPGAAPDYKPGVVMLYQSLRLPCCPVALNSGLFWPRRHWRRYPGTLIVEFLPPIAPGLKREHFESEMQARIETATHALIAETLAGPNPPPRPEGYQG